MSAHSTASLRLRSVIMKDGQRLLCCDHLEQDGEGLDRMACEHGLEAEELSQIHPDLQAWKKMGGFRASLVLASAALRGLHLRRGEMSRIISRRCGISSHCAPLRRRLQTSEQLEEEWGRHDSAYPELTSPRDFHLQTTLMAR